MKIKNNIVYILSSCYYDKLMYVQKFNLKEFATLKLCRAEMFHSIEHAKHFLSVRTDSAYWQIQPISSKTIFKAQLEGI